MTAAKKYSIDQLMNVVLAPVVSEKSTFVADKNRQYVFRVADHATKPEIKAAIELMFKTKVDDVTVLNVRGKERRFGRLSGRRRSWKNRSSNSASLLPGGKSSMTGRPPG